MRVRVLVLLAALACTAPPGPGGTPGDPTGEALVPSGFGSLRQEEITLTLRSGDLLIKVTPLDEGVIRLTAPDTYQRLAALARSHREELARISVRRDPILFLVSFFSYAPNVIYEPEDLHLVSLGLRYRPAGILGVTPRWDAHRLEQEELEMAVYAFDADLDLGTDLLAEYEQASVGGWDAILNRLDAERARVRARAGGPGTDQTSRSNFWILR